MKFTLSWLAEHLETEAGIEEIAEALTDLGLEVEGIVDPAATLGAFRIARVIEAVQHPDADRLRVCRVEVRAAEGAPPEEVQVVCGAPNARTGMVGVFAPPGTHVPGTGVDLKPGVIRGVESNGMLCSERELMLSDDHEGIIDLPADAPLGARYIDWAGLNDPVIEIAITPNRPDALGVAGIARDLAARGLGRVITPAVEPVPGRFLSPIPVRLAPEVAGGPCPLFCGRYIRGVRNGPSPAWLQARLRAIGLRPISALVDITNFVTFDRARPLHVFDAAKVTGGIEVRRARAGESLLALDGRDYAFDGTETLIADEAGPEAIGGIIGGEHSGCTEDTVDVFLESAWFDPQLTAATGRRLKINSDARYRFERGVDPAFTPMGMELATRMILDLCGGEPSEPVIVGAVPGTARSYALDPARVVRLVGMEIARAEQARILTALGFAVTEGEVFDVAVPSWRPDVQGEADLVEEVARIASLTRLPAQPLRRPASGVTRPTRTLSQTRAARVRREMAAAGLDECVTYSFVSAREAELFGGGGEALRLENPISSEMSHMRPGLLPGLMAAAARNQARGFADLALFEVGPAFSGGEPGEQAQHATALRVGHTAPRNAFGTRRPVDAFDAKADALAALAAAGVPAERLTLLRDDLPGWLHPGRSGWLGLGPKLRLALMGELHPKVLEAMEVRGPAVAATIFLGALPAPRARAKTRPALEISDFQPVERDFAFVLDAAVAAEAVLKAARGADRTLIARAEIFDVFEGEKAEAQLGAGRKSLAISVRLEPRRATLTEAEIDEVAEKVVAAVAKATGGELRG